MLSYLMRHRHFCLFTQDHMERFWLNSIPKPSSWTRRPLPSPHRTRSSWHALRFPASWQIQEIIAKVRPRLCLDSLTVRDFTLSSKLFLPWLHPGPHPKSWTASNGYCYRLCGQCHPCYPGGRGMCHRQFYQEYTYCLPRYYLFYSISSPRLWRA